MEKKELFLAAKNEARDERKKSFKGILERLMGKKYSLGEIQEKLGQSMNEARFMSLKPEQRDVIMRMKSSAEAKKYFKAFYESNQIKPRSPEKSVSESKFYNALTPKLKQEFDLLDYKERRTLLNIKDRIEFIDSFELAVKNKLKRDEAEKARKEALALKDKTEKEQAEAEKRIKKYEPSDVAALPGKKYNLPEDVSFENIAKIKGNLNETDRDKLRSVISRDLLASPQLNESFLSNMADYSMFYDHGYDLDFFNQFVSANEALGRTSKDAISELRALIIRKNAAPENIMLLRGFFEYLKQKELEDKIESQAIRWGYSTKDENWRARLSPKQQEQLKSLEQEANKNIKKEVEDVVSPKFIKEMLVKGLIK